MPGKYQYEKETKLVRMSYPLHILIPISQRLEETVYAICLEHGVKTDPRQSRLQGFECKHGTCRDHAACRRVRSGQRCKKLAHSKDPSVLSKACFLCVPSRFYVPFEKIRGNDDLVESLTKLLLPQHSDRVFSHADVHGQCLENT